jgi:hypothetical protein
MSSIANMPGVSAATQAAQSPTADAVQMNVLKKALDTQTAAAATLLQGIPQAPQLATEGSVGRHVNTYA